MGTFYIQFYVHLLELQETEGDLGARVPVISVQKNPHLPLYPTGYRDSGNNKHFQQLFFPKLNSLASLAGHDTRKSLWILQCYCNLTLI